jgi:hypothetical protein
VAEVNEIVIETPRVKSLLLRVTGWQGHLPGQHVDIRLCAADLSLTGALCSLVAQLFSEPPYGEKAPILSRYHFHSFLVGSSF